MTSQIMHIGLDDTDSKKGGCTTYLTAILVHELAKFNVEFIDYPGLIRLNPNVPWKTRGNGALNIRFAYDTKYESQIKETVIKLWKEHSALNEKGTDPGLVIYKAEQIPAEVTAFAKKAETTIVSINEAKLLIKKIGAESWAFNSCRGLIGSLAAIGEILQEDYTFELIAYRIPEKLGTKRLVDEESIFEMDKQTCPFTFNNVDYEKKRIIIAPRGPDPVFFGIRGETPNDVLRAFKLVKTLEPVERWLIFRSNQGTDAHLRTLNDLRQLEVFSSFIAKGIISKNPTIVPVRHVVFSIEDEYIEVDCAAYEPTGDLRKVAIQLVVGDEIEVYGAVQRATKAKPITINLEKIKILNLVNLFKRENPVCPACKKRLESMGKNQAFRCKKCGAKFHELKKKETIVVRAVQPGLYITSTRSQRHLTKPHKRYGLEKKEYITMTLIDGWRSN